MPRDRVPDRAGWGCAAGDGRWVRFEGEDVVVVDGRVASGGLVRSVSVVESPPRGSQVLALP